MTPTDMAERARDVANEFGLSIDVLDEARMEQEGMGSLLSVSHGSEQPAKLIILKYVPANFDDNNKDLLAFVGKGVTFDSGGISLKPGENMITIDLEKSTRRLSPKVNVALSSIPSNNCHRLSEAFSISSNSTSETFISSVCIRSRFSWVNIGDVSR